MLKEIEDRIQVLAFSEKERYDNYIKRIQAIKQDLSSLDDRDNTIGEKNRVMEAIGKLDLETKMYIEYGTNFEKNEDTTLTLEPKGPASGKEKAKQARIQLYKSICEDLKKLEEINLEDIKKIKEQWDIEKDSSLKYSVSEIEQIEELISDVLLDYYIKYIKQNKAMPEELDLNEYTNVEEFAKRIKEKIMEMISQRNVDRLKQLEYFNILNNLSDEEIIDNEMIWEEITGVPIKFEQEQKNEVTQVESNHRDDFTFLTKEQCYGDNRLEILQKRGKTAVLTDFAILLGGYVSHPNCNDVNYLGKRIGWYWTKSAHKDGNVLVLTVYSTMTTDEANKRSGGARPALSFLSIDSIPTNGVMGRRDGNGILEVNYGYYPQEAVPIDMQKKLEKLYKRGHISKTKNSYITDSVPTDSSYSSIRFEKQTHEEYEYKGKRYVRVRANLNYIPTTLSNGVEYKTGDYIWVEVQPIKWLVDEKEKIMITEKIMFAGVQFKHNGDYKTGGFDKTDIKQFMDNYWSKDILQVLKQQQLESKSSDDFEGR